MNTSTRSATTIVISNTKGGTAKTTTALNLATELSSQNYKVLLFDFDPQGAIKGNAWRERITKFKGIEEF